MIKSRLNFLINLRTGLRTFELQNSQKLRNLSLTQILGVLIKKKACIAYGACTRSIIGPELHPEL